MLNTKETPHAKAIMITANVMRKRRTSFIMWFMERMMGPKYLEAMPTWGENNTRVVSIWPICCELCTHKVAAHNIAQVKTWRAIFLQETDFYCPGRFLQREGERDRPSDLV